MTPRGFVTLYGRDGKALIKKMPTPDRLRVNTVQLLVDQNLADGVTDAEAWARVWRAV